MVFLLALATAAQGYWAEKLPEVRLSAEERRVISRDCGIPRRWLRARPEGTVRFRPSPKARYEQVNCVVERLRRVSDRH
jgi:hypothetical protein